MNGDVTLLCTGDLHLGRHPTRIPPDADGDRFSPAAVWRATVREAIERDVDAVLVAGDVVDRENRFFEAYGPVEAGVERLADAGIPVVLVAGNHDFDALPRLIDGVDAADVTLLGADGDWERTAVERDGDPVCYVDGWSFPTEHVRQSPLSAYDRSRPADAPLLGLVHGDLDAAESEYAPIATSDLVGTPADAWVLGHAHQRDVRRPADPFVGYAGSPQALDPGERGAHGPWLLTLDSTGGVTAEHLPLATVRYDRLDVDASGVADATAIPGAVSDRVSAHVRDEVETGHLDLLLARVTLTGRTAAHGDLADRREEIEDQLAFSEGSLSVRVERLDVETRPDVDLEALADGDDPAAHVADLLLALDAGEAVEEYPDLVRDAREAMRRAYASSAYEELRRETDVERPGEDDALATLERQATRLLDELLTQTEAGQA